MHAFHSETGRPAWKDLYVSSAGGLNHFCGKIVPVHDSILHDWVLAQVYMKLRQCVYVLNSDSVRRGTDLDSRIQILL